MTRAEPVDPDLPDPACEWLLDDGSECGADRVVFAVARGWVQPVGPATPTIRRTSIQWVCPEHLVGVIVADEDPFSCSIVMPIAEEPLRGRPPAVMAL